MVRRGRRRRTPRITPMQHRTVTRPASWCMACAGRRGILLRPRLTSATHRKAPQAHALTCAYLLSLRCWQPVVPHTGRHGSTGELCRLAQAARRGRCRSQRRERGVWREGPRVACARCGDTKYSNPLFCCHNRKAWAKVPAAGTSGLSKRAAETPLRAPVSDRGSQETKAMRRARQEGVHAVAKSGEL